MRLASAAPVSLSGMRQRVISAAVLVPVVVILFVLGPPWLTLAIALLAALAAYETAQLVTRAGLGAAAWFAVIAVPLAVLGLAWAVGPGAQFDLPLAFVAPAVAFVIVASAVIALRLRDPADGLREWLGTILATLYPSLLAFAAALVGIAPAEQTSSLFGLQLDSGRILLLILVLTVWTLDTGAYVSGKLLPRGHFMNHISPNKTWSGAIGGTVAAVVVCTVLVAGTQLPLYAGWILGLIIAIAAQAGDLTESMLKRAAATKDSGTLIPGHGGFLDRVDSFLFAAPALYMALIAYALLWRPPSP